jgi:hypothetical protein
MRVGSASGAIRYRKRKHRIVAMVMQEPTGVAVLAWLTAPLV